MLIMRPMGLSRERKDRMEEKIYKTMSGRGAMRIAGGEVTLDVGLVCVILVIVGGAKLLSGKSKILF